MRKFLLDYVAGLAGGLVGGLVGYLAVGFLMGQTGFWVPILPGAFAGLACGQLSRSTSRVRGILNGLLALGIAIYAQWKLFQYGFQETGSLPEFLGHVHQLPLLTLIVLALNGLLGFWWGREERIGSSRVAPRPTEN